MERKFRVGDLLTTGDFSAPDFFSFITKIVIPYGEVNGV